VAELMNKKEFIKLSWELLEHRVRYYYYDASIIDDYQYDMLEKKYIKACKQLKQPNTIGEMVGVDLEKPSIQSVITKLGIATAGYKVK
jgi:NAD-dependent DNA ligase